MGLYVDDNIVYQGILKQNSPSAILFTDDPVFREYQPFIYIPSADELVLMFDEEKPTADKLEKARPATAVKR